MVDMERFWLLSWGDISINLVVLEIVLNISWTFELSVLFLTFDFSQVNPVPGFMFDFFSELFLELFQFMMDQFLDICHDVILQILKRVTNFQIKNLQLSLHSIDIFLHCQSSLR